MRWPMTGGREPFRFVALDKDKEGDDDEEDDEVDEVDGPESLSTSSFESASIEGSACREDEEGGDEDELVDGDVTEPMMRFRREQPIKTYCWTGRLNSPPSIIIKIIR